MRAPATVYKGIEFVKLQELPTEQQVLLQSNQQIERIKIMIEGKIVSNCIQYKDYDNWFSASYETSSRIVPVKKDKQPVFAGSLAFDNV